MKNLIKLGYEIIINRGCIALFDNVDGQPKAEYDVINKTLKTEHLDLHTLEVFLKVINTYESGK